MSEFIDPTPTGRVKIVLSVLALVAVLEASRRWALPHFMYHVKTLDECTQLSWITYAVFTLLLLQSVTLSALILPFAARSLRHKQFPPPGTWVWTRTRIQRGQAANLRAYLLIGLCVITYAPCLWVGYEANDFIKLGNCEK